MYLKSICKAHKIHKSHYAPLSEQQPNPNKCVFSFCVNTGNVRSGHRSSGGRSFHSWGKEGSSREASVFKFVVCALHKQHLDVIGARVHWSTTEIWQVMTVVSEVCGCHDWWTNPAILKMIRWRTGSQCSCRSKRVTWSHHRASVTRRTSAFCTDCTRHSSSSLIPCSSELQLCALVDYNMFWASVTALR